MGKHEWASSEEGWYSSLAGQPHPNTDSNSSSKPNISHARAVTSTINKILNEGGLKGGRYVTTPEYHNPDLLVRLIGPANEGKVEIEGVKN